MICKVIGRTLNRYLYGQGSQKMNWRANKRRVLPVQFTIEQCKQKADERVRSVRYKVIEDYSHSCCPLNKGNKIITNSCIEEPQIQLQKGEFILATRELQYCLYGDKILDDSFVDVSRIRGWFPRNHVEKCPVMLKQIQSQRARRTDSHY